MPDSLASGPRLYGNMLSIGGTIADIDAWPQRIAAVRPADVVAAAQHVWREAGQVTSLLDSGGGQPMIGRRTILAASVGIAVSLASLRAEAVEIKEVRSKLGIKAWLVEDRSVPVLTLSFSFAGGSATEPEAQKGVTSLMATLLTDGAGALPAQAFKRQEAAAVSLGFSASLDRLSGALRVLSANRAEGIALLRLALSAPRFDRGAAGAGVRRQVFALARPQRRRPRRDRRADLAVEPLFRSSLRPATAWARARAGAGHHGGRICAAS